MYVQLAIGSGPRARELLFGNTSRPRALQFHSSNILATFCAVTVFDISLSVSELAAFC